MDNEELYASRGPVSTMPGSSQAIQDTKCDQHEDRDAVRRVQGETDSFGCEYIMMCQECLDKHRAFRLAELDQPKHCDWCNTMQTGVSKHRDYEEGSAGRLYDVCVGCRAKESEAARAELDASRYGDDDFFDDSDDDPSWNHSEGHGPDLHHDVYPDPAARGRPDEREIAAFYASPTPLRHNPPVVTYKRRPKQLER